MSQDAINILLDSLRSLQKTSDYSDLKILCGDEVFSVHKAIICPRSEFFSTACSWGKDGQSKNEIELEDDDPEIVKLMIDYFYQLDYKELPIPADSTIPTMNPAEPVECVEPVPVLDDPWATNTSSIKKTKKKEKKRHIFVEEEPFEEEPRVAHQPVTVKARLQDLAQNSDANRIVINAQLYALADKYGIEDLKRLALAKFSNAAEQNWRSEAFVQASRLIFEDTPTNDLGLRAIVVKIMHNHKELMDYEEVQELLNSGNGIAWHLVKSLLSRF